MSVTPPQQRPCLHAELLADVGLQQHTALVPASSVAQWRSAGTRITFTFSANDELQLLRDDQLVRSVQLPSAQCKQWRLTVLVKGSIVILLAWNHTDHGTDAGTAAGADADAAQHPCDVTASTEAEARPAEPAPTHAALPYQAIGEPSASVASNECSSTHQSDDESSLVPLHCCGRHRQPSCACGNCLGDMHSLLVQR